MNKTELTLAEQNFSARFNRRWDWALPFLREEPVDLDALVDVFVTLNTIEALVKDKVRCVAVLTATPVSADRAIGLANLIYEMHDNANRIAESEAAFREAIRLDPSRAYAWNGLGCVLGENPKAPIDDCSGREVHEARRKEALAIFSDAEAAFREAIRLEPRDKLFWSNLAWLFSLDRKRSVDAKAAAQEAIRLDPSDVKNWVNLGHLLADKDKLCHYEEAEAAFREAIRLDPRDADNWYFLARVLNKNPNRDAEETAYREAIKLDPTDVYPWTGLGDLLKNTQSRRAEASDAYLQAISLLPSRVYLWKSLHETWKDEGSIVLKQTAESIHALFSLACNGGEKILFYVTRITIQLCEAGKANECYVAALQTNMLDKLRAEYTISRMFEGINALQAPVENNPHVELAA